MRGWLLALVALFTVAATPAAAQPRIALTIGVSNYNDDDTVDVSTPAVEAAIQAGFATDLRNAVNDARLVRDALTRAAFTVRHLENPDRATLAAAVKAFGDDARAAGPDALVFFYFAGHGITVDGFDYLVPARAKPPDLSGLDDGEFSDIDSGAVSRELDRVMGRLPGLPAPAEPKRIRTGDRIRLLQAAFLPIEELRSLVPAADTIGFRVFVFDSCRNNPWRRDYATEFQGNTRASFRALEGWGLFGDGMPRRLPLYAYSAEQGQVALDGAGANGLYAESLARRLRGTRQTIGQMFERVTQDVSAASGRRQVPRAFVDLSHSSSQCIVSCPATQP